MAKARQALSMWKGRAGGVVYSVLNGNQIMRSAPASVSNPKSDAQVAQRMKLAPAQNFYKQLEALVSLGFSSHTFQGKKYGNANRLRFLQLAMMNNQGPYVPKDTMEFIPFDYQVSEGSLPAFTGRMYLYEDTARLNEIADAIADVTITAENVEQWANAFGCNVGDQISILTVDLVNGYYIPRVVRFLVQAGVDLNELANDYDISLWLPTGKTLVTASFGSILIKGEGEAICAVLSRQQANGEFLRSSEYMHISTAIREKYYTPAALDAAIRSYQDVKSANSTDPYYNNLGSQAWPGTIYASVMSFNVNGRTGKATILWGKTDGGNKVIFTADGTSASGLIALQDNGQPGILYTLDSVGDYVPVKLENITTAVQWAGIDVWKDEYFSQWESGQKAVRPIVTPPTVAPFTEALASLLDDEGLPSPVVVKKCEVNYSEQAIDDCLVFFDANNEPWIAITDVSSDPDAPAQLRQVQVEQAGDMLTFKEATVATTYSSENAINIDGVNYNPGKWHVIALDYASIGNFFPVSTTTPIEY